jgi:hypothetical protein
MIALTKQRKKKKLSLTQAYTKLYWRDRIEDEVEQHWRKEWLADHPEYDASNPFHRIPKPGIAFRNRIVQMLYDAEPEDIKREIEKHRDQTGEQSDSDDNADNAKADEAVNQRKLRQEQQT